MHSDQEKDFVEYVHPWCNRLFIIKREFFGIQGNPEVCCMFCTQKKAAECDVALRNWKK